PSLVSVVANGCSSVLVSPRSRSHGIAQNAESGYFQRDDVAGFEPLLVHRFKDASRTHGARSQDVTWIERGVARGAFTDLLPREMHVGEFAPRGLDAVDPRGHRASRSIKFVDGDETRSHAGREVFCLGGPQTDTDLFTLDVTGRPVIENGETGDCLVGPNDRSDFELIIKLLSSVGIDDDVLGTDDRRGVREVEGGLAIPEVGN